MLPYTAWLAGDIEHAAAVLDAVRDETGARVDEGDHRDGRAARPRGVDRAADFAIDHGADFVKTSTGKTPISATPEAAEIVLEAIAVSGRPVGFKASGGIRTLADARAYLDLADEIMGAGWATPATFRFGASWLLDALESVVAGTTGGGVTEQRLMTVGAGHAGEAERIEHLAGLVDVEVARLDHQVDDRPALVEARWTSSAARA